MKISEVNCEFGRIYFDNGNYIEISHDRDCCENNYADLEQLEDSALDFDFPEKLVFENVREHGFRFGDGKTMFFIPCYSKQNGYYSSKVTISYWNKQRFAEEYEIDCELIYR